MLDSVQTVGASLRVQQEQPLCSEILAVQQFFFRQRMVNRENSRDTDLRQLLVYAGLFLRPFFLERRDHVHGFLLQELVEMLEGDNLKDRIQRGTGLRHSPQNIGQQPQLVVAVAANGKELPLIAHRLFKPLLCQSDDIQHIPGVVQKDQALLGDLHRPRGAPEQLRVQLFFQGANLMGDGRLCHVELPGGFYKAERLRNRQKTGELSSMVMCLLINARLSMIFLAAIVVVAAALALIMSRAMKIFSRVFHRYDGLNASVQENISAIRVVKAFVREDYENEKFTKAATKLYELFVRAEKLQALNLPVMMFIVYGCILAISWFGAHFIVAGSMTTGSLTSLFSYVMTAFSSLMMLSMIFVMMTMSAASGKRIAEVLEETAGITNPSSAPISQVRDGSVDFNHVAFSYRQGTGEKTLDDVDLHIKSGETVGVIGGTGCGKSSLVSLISRLYDVDSGSVKVGGEDVRSYDLETLRSQVAVVLQKNVLFSGTVLENLSWGKKMGHMDEYREACRMSCADEFLERLPEHYESWVERGGANFSGGQKQRLCIARALLRHPKVLILDDSTSAVDTATDAKIRKALRTVIPGTTKIIIAQRISSVQDADRILVLDSGKISGFDTHENLLKSNAIYREIYEAQTKGGGDFDHEQTGE